MKYPVKIRRGELTPWNFSSYTRLVRFRIIATGFLGVWLVLLTGDFCEDLGLFNENPAFDLALDGALADLGQAVGICNHSGTAARLAPNDHTPATAALVPVYIYTNGIFRVALRETHSPPEPATRQSEFNTVLRL